LGCTAPPGHNSHQPMGPSSTPRMLTQQHARRSSFRHLPSSPPPALDSKASAACKL
jgi:hypothetical protein